MIERQIIIGLITSAEYLKRVKSVWNPELLESNVARLLSLWVWEYYDAYGKAPGKDIESIFFTKLKEGMVQKDVAEEIEEEILPSLSEEYTQEEFNLEYLWDETKKYFNDRHLAVHSEIIESLRAKGKLEEAEKIAREFRPLGLSVHNLNNFILSVQDIRTHTRPTLTTLMRPWLKEGQTTIIYGSYGSGKSLLAIAIAYLLGLKDFDGKECEIGEWQVKKRSGTLYIDGELGEQEMEDRIKKFEWLGTQLRPIRILSLPEYQLITEDAFYISNRENQLKIIQWLKSNRGYKLVILDSASTLFGLVDENDNSEWNNKVNPFLRDLRALGVACILLHHAGKDNRRGLRGASAMGAMAHNIFKLSNHGDNDIDDGEAWFVLSKDKQRAGGYSFKMFGLRFFQENDETETHWEVTGIGDAKK
jgi:energy-coupling factor transporter ATP-binding protein EcfA2